MLEKEGLPPRDRNADVPEHTNNVIAWMAGAIIVCSLIAIVLFGTMRMETPSGAKLNTAPGMTTGSAPASPSKPAQ